MATFDEISMEQKEKAKKIFFGCNNFFDDGIEWSEWNGIGVMNSCGDGVQKKSTRLNEGDLFQYETWH